ncbi:MAG: NUDIX hydrolase [Burkholderiales bacterium]|nr:NUDIX hydrolase [Burkholderiales bacterium]
MKGRDLAERFVSGGEVWAGRLLRVHRDRVRLPDGREAVREYVRHPGAVCIVPLHADGRVVLVRQYRHPLAREFVELPAGKKDPGEDPLVTAQRELAEETGYTATEWRRFGVIHNAIGYSDEAIELYLARGLSAGASAPEDGEFLEAFAVPFAEALAMIRDGRITDAKTVCALLWVERFGR